MIKSIISDVRESVFRLRNTKFDIPNLTFPYKYNDTYCLDQLTNDGNKYAPPLIPNNYNPHNRNSIKNENCNGNNIKSEDGKIKLENNTTNNHTNNTNIKIEKETSIKSEKDSNNSSLLNTPKPKQHKSRSNSPKIKVEKDVIMEDKTENNNTNNDNKECIYTLPDGQKIFGGEWQFSIPELMFIDYHEMFRFDLEDEWIDKMQKLFVNKNNEMIDLNKFNDPYYYENTSQIWNDKDYKTFKFKGLSSMIIEALNDCDVDIRPLCMKNVIICGGHSRYRGFIERIAKELTLTVPYSYKYKLQFNLTPRERLFASWLGGSILSSTTSFQNMWITKEQYQEYGKGIVHRKCL